jgi:hypothetical protein
VRLLSDELEESVVLAEDAKADLDRAGIYDTCRAVRPDNY